MSQQPSSGGDQAGKSHREPTRPSSRCESGSGNREVLDEPHQPNLPEPQNCAVLSRSSSNLSASNDTLGCAVAIRPPVRSSHTSAAARRSQTLSGIQEVTPTVLNSTIIAVDDQSQGTLCWHTARPTVRERNASMLFNDLMADVFFVVGPPGSPSQQRIPAHSYVLATGSNVFYAMFHGSFSKTGDIAIPDVEPSAFRIVLRYLYTDEVDLSEDNVLSVLYTAKKYMIPHLIRSCIDFLETSLTAKNVCCLLAQSRLFEEDELMLKCWDLIDAQAEMALKSEGFLEIDFNTLESILSRDTLNVKEETAVFDAALRWANAECIRQELETTPTNSRKVLGGAFSLLRLASMKIEEFADGPAQSGLLSDKEITDIFLHYTAKVKPTLNVVLKPRTGLHMRRCHRFQSSAYRSNQWRYRGRCDSIQFCTDRRIFVAGFGLYGSSNGAAEYRVHMELKRLGETLAVVTTKFFSDGSSSVFSVFFEQPIQIEPEVYYTASVVLEGSELSFFGQEGMPDVTVYPVTFQFQCSTESTNGTGVQGGQIPEILFYA